MDTISNEEKTRTKEHKTENDANDSVVVPFPLGASVAPAVQSVTLDPDNMLLNAKRFLKQEHTKHQTPTLRRYKQTFYEWNGAFYKYFDDEAIKTKIYEFLHELSIKRKALRLHTDEIYEVTASNVNALFDAVKAVCKLNDDIALPAWIDQSSSDKPAKELLCCANGLVHLPTGHLRSATPRYFTLTGTDFDYEPEPEKPEQWLSFLNSVWPGQPECIGVLQETMGYLVSPDTSQHKIFLLIGPPRSGKGTIGRILKGLLGADNVAGMTLAGLGTNFGLQDMMNRPLALISDARLDRSVRTEIIERLLSISGEDRLTVDRKYKSHWTGTFPTRFLIMTNELPKLSENSGALAKRFVPLAMTKSFYGNEDRKLTEKLSAELPSILRWAMEGLWRLNERGHFLLPDASKTIIQDLEQLGSPVRAWASERCRFDSNLTTSKELLYGNWRSWCEDNGHIPGAKNTFCRNLKAAFQDKIQECRPRGGQGRVTAYRGIGLRLAETEASGQG